MKYLVTIETLGAINPLNQNHLGAMMSNFNNRGMVTEVREIKEHEEVVVRDKV